MKKEEISLKCSPFLIDILKKRFKKDSLEILKKSLLLQYIGLKTLSVNKDSKSRQNLSSLYSIYVLVEDYLKNRFDKRGYSKYKGAEFTNLLKRLRKLPFGDKFQNHSLNNRCNDDFRKYFPKSREAPIIRNLFTKKYWINEKLLLIKLGKKNYNISEVVIDMIDEYASLRTYKFKSFFDTCLYFKKEFNKDKFVEFVKSQIMPNVDARIFEIVSFCILKQFYSINGLTLYKTGRTNANDGGIDFVMRPEGRFFQVSEVLDFKKYFLDIDKILHFPITFVIKSDKKPKELMELIKERAKTNYDEQTLNNYLNAIEEIISIPTLIDCLDKIIKSNKYSELLEDLILYYKIEFNIK